MLGKLTWDILRFLYLYLEFYIPYACAFWMIFGKLLEHSIQCPFLSLKAFDAVICL